MVAGHQDKRLAGRLPLELESGLERVVECPQCAHQRGHVVVMSGGIGVLVFHQQHKAVRVVARQQVERSACHFGRAGFFRRIAIDLKAHVLVREQRKKPPAARGLHRCRRACDLITFLCERGDHVAAIGALAAGGSLGQKEVAPAADQHVRLQREIPVDDRLAVAPVLHVHRERCRRGVVYFCGGHQTDALAGSLGCLHHRARRGAVGRH